MDDYTNNVHSFTPGSKKSNSYVDKRGLDMTELLLVYESWKLTYISIAIMRMRRAIYWVFSHLDKLVSKKTGSYL